MRIRYALIFAALGILPMLAQTPAARPAGADWPMYNRDLMGTRHSPLTQITTANVSRLRQSWTFKIGKDQTAGSISGGSEYTPIVAGGLMYVLTSNAAVALEPDTGKEVWRYAVQGGVPSRRGTGYWPGDASTPARVFFTSGRRLIGLQALTGEPVQGFGTSGTVDIERPYNGTVTVHKHMLLVGTNGTPGAVRAFDARTGAKVWEFRPPITTSGTTTSRSRPCCSTSRSSHDADPHHRAQDGLHVHPRSRYRRAGVRDRGALRPAERRAR